MIRKRKDWPRGKGGFSNKEKERRRKKRNATPTANHYTAQYGTRHEKGRASCRATSSKAVCRMDKSFDPAGETRKSRTLSRLGDDDAETGGFDQREMAHVLNPFSLPSLFFLRLARPACCEEWIAPAEGGSSLAEPVVGTRDCELVRANRRLLSTAGGQD